MNVSSRSRILGRLAARTSALALVYTVTGVAGLAIDSLGGVTTLLWPPAGIALAVLIWAGPGLAPGVFAGALAVARSNHLPWPVALGIAAGSTLEGLLGAWALRRSRFHAAVDRAHDALALVAAAVASSAAGATAAVASLALGGVVSDGRRGATWRTWWLGDLIAELLVTPLLLDLAVRAWRRPRGWRAAEVAILGAMTVAVLGLITGGLLPGRGPFEHAYMLFPLLCWAALRFGRRGATLELAAISVAMVWLTATGRGPFVVPGSLHDSLFFLQAFSAVAALTALALGAVSDERGRAARALEASEQRARAVLDSALDCIVTIDGDGRVQEFNPAAERILGHRRADVLGRPLDEVLIPPRLREAHRAGLAQLEATGRGPLLGRRVEMPALHADGSELTVELAISGTLIGGERSYTGFLRDVSERVRREQGQAFLDLATRSLGSSLDVAETLDRVARLPLPYLADACAVDIEDASGELVKRAAASSSALGDALERWVGRKVDGRPGASHGAPRVFETGEVEIHPAPAEPSWDGAPVDASHPDPWRDMGVRSYMSLPIEARGRRLGVVSFLRCGPPRRYSAEDLAVAREYVRRAALALDNARLYQQADAAIRIRDEFIVLAAHELKTPLTPLKLHLGVIRRALRKDEAAQDRLAVPLARATDQVDRVARLVELLLDASHCGGALPLQPAPDDVDLCGVVAGVVKRHQRDAQQAGSTLQLRAPRPVAGRWDLRRVEQLVSILLSNAIKFGEGRPVDVGVEEHAGTVHLSVTDRGAGIAAQDLARIFGRYERAALARHYGGLGLGLYLARCIAESHGGTLDARSEPGQGATFTAVLPLRPGAVARNAAGPSDGASTPESRETAAAMDPETRS